jgi:hypothetical protein
MLAPTVSLITFTTFLIEAILLRMSFSMAKGFSIADYVLLKDQRVCEMHREILQRYV